MNTGNDILAAAAQHIGGRYRLGAIAPKTQPGYFGDFDCAEFCSYINYQVARQLAGARPSDDPVRADAYTGFFGEDANAGKLVKITVSAAAQTPGAMLLRLPLPGTIGHIAFSDGRGGTIEAHSTKRGIIRSVVTGRVWSYGLLLPFGVDYSVNPAVHVEPAKDVYFWTSPMMQGPVVERIQRALVVVDDGVFGELTHKAVVAFQKREGLLVDGMVGDETLRELNIIV